MGRVTKAGDALVRIVVCKAANVMLTRAVRFATLDAWATKLAARQAATVTLTGK